LFGLIDLNTGLFMSRGPMGQTLAGLGSYNGLIYGGAYHGNTLYSVDTSTGALLPIGTGNLTYGDFGSTTSGLYAFGGDGNLYSINPATGAATEIGPTGLSFGGIVMGMSSGSNTLYLTQNNSLYSLNTTTGSATWSRLPMKANPASGLWSHPAALYLEEHMVRPRRMFIPLIPKQAPRRS
jgi:outer membrane protein assembly factor BamB